VQSLALRANHWSEIQASFYELAFLSGAIWGFVIRLPSLPSALAFDTSYLFDFSNTNAIDASWSKMAWTNCDFMACPFLILKSAGMDKTI